MSLERPTPSARSSGRPDVGAHRDWIEAVGSDRDRGSYSDLFRYYAPRVKTYLVRRGIAGSLAEELAQDTMLAVWRKAETFNPSRSEAATWIYTIARNVAIDAFRRDRTRARADMSYDMDEQEAPQRPDQALEYAQSEARLRRALAALPPNQVDVVWLSFFADRTHGEIARQLDVPLGTVKGRLRCAGVRLRALLGGRGTDC